MEWLAFKKHPGWTKPGYYIQCQRSSPGWNEVGVTFPHRNCSQSIKFSQFFIWEPCRSSTNYSIRGRNVIELECEARIWCSRTVKKWEKYQTEGPSFKEQIEILPSDNSKRIILENCRRRINTSLRQPLFRPASNDLFKTQSMKKLLIPILVLGCNRYCSLYPSGRDRQSQLSPRLK